MTNPDFFRYPLATTQAATKDDLRAATREIIGHFNSSQDQQNERLDRIEQKVDGLARDVSKIKLAVVDLIATDRHLRNLVAALKREGIKVTDAEVFSS